MKVLAEDDAAFASADTGGRRNHIQCQHFLLCSGERAGWSFFTQAEENAAKNGGAYPVL